MKAGSRDFIIRQEVSKYNFVILQNLKGRPLFPICGKAFYRSFGIRLKPNEKRRITMTIKESNGH